jgi:TolB-like protein/DNA-binding winged helix-turn-helix (wHTH) protein/tetratricopeptide (TPR) repeat protein
MAAHRGRAFEFGTFRLVPEERLFLQDGEEIAVPPKAFDLLVLLVENHGHLVTKDELMRQIWPDSFVEEANLSVKMSALRRILGESPQDQRYIQTVPRKGYRFVADVGTHDQVPDSPSLQASIALPTPVPADVTADRTKSLAYRRRYIYFAGTIALLLVLGLGLGTGLFQLTRLTSETAAAERIGVIAVLPLENLSGDETQEYFSDGMTDALITDLAKISSLRIISRTSVMQYKGSARPIGEIAQELKVDAFVTGSVLRSGDRLRISVQLIRARTSEMIWSNSYQRSMRDVLALQNELTRSIIGEIRVKLTPQEQLRFGTVPPVSPEAYDKYFLGKYYLNRQKENENQLAIDALEAAVAADPSFAAAYAELAQAYVWKSFLFKPGQLDLNEKAYVASEKAIAIDPNLAVGYLARGRVLWTPANHFSHDRAIREYRHALELNPGLDEARNQLALIYNHIGATDEALSELNRALETNPGNTLAQFRIGETLLFAGKYNEALAILRNVPNDANPALVGHQLSWALWNLGRKDEAASTLREFLAKYPEDNRGLLTSIEAVMAAADGRMPEAETLIKQAIGGKGFGHFHHTAFHIACAYARMNKPDRAIDFLESAANEGFPNYTLFSSDPNLESLRSNSRFIYLMERLRRQLEQYRSNF